jgi:hypothetical protein
VKKINCYFRKKIREQKERKKFSFFLRVKKRMYFNQKEEEKNEMFHSLGF